MKRQSRPRRSEKRLRHTHPIAGQLPDWYFRGDEVAVGRYRVEGMDLWGRKVSSVGERPDLLLEQCIADARSLDSHPPAPPTVRDYLGRIGDSIIWFRPGTAPCGPSLLVIVLLPLVSWRLLDMAIGRRKPERTG